MKALLGRGDGQGGTGRVGIGGRRGRSWATRAAGVLVVVLVAQFVYGLLLLVDRGRDYTALVDGTGWQVDGDVFPLATVLAATEVPTEITNDPRYVMWRTWSPERGNTAGRVASPAFRTPDYLAVPYQGFPNESAGNRVFVRCDESGREADVAVRRTNAEFATVFMRLGASFCTGQSRLIATSDGSKYVAIGTPFETSARLFHLQTGLAARAAIALATLVSIACLCFVGHFAGRRWLGRDELFTGGLALTGCLGMLQIALFVATPHATTITGAVFVAILVGTVMIARRRRTDAKRWWDAAWRPLTLWGLVCLAYVALLCAADCGGGSWATNGFFSPLRWSSDNQLPMIVTEGFYHRVPADKIMISAWHGFDRTPLLSGLLLPFRVVLLDPIVAMAGPVFLPIGYSVVCIVLLSTWVIVLYEGCRLVGLQRAATYVVGLAAICPFFVFNTVYVWPKLLGGSFAVLAFCLLLRLKSQRRTSGPDLVVVAICAACSYLSHASNAFVLIAIALFFVPTIVRQRWRPVLFATFAGGVLLLSWTAFVDATQPHSNALLRYALANDFGFADRTKPLWDSTVVAYRNLGWNGWFALKAGEFGRLFVFAPFSNEMAPLFAGNAWAGAARVTDFATPARSLGIAFLAAIVAALLPPRWATDPQVEASRPFAIVGIGGVVLAVLILLPEATTHQLPYGAAMLIFIGGASLIHSTGAVRRTAVFLASAAYFFVVWVYDPVSSGLRLNPGAIAVLVEIVSLSLLLFPRDAEEGTASPSSRRDMRARTGADLLQDATP